MANVELKGPIKRQGSC